MLTLIPVSLAQANEFVRQHHRHHKPVAAIITHSGNNQYGSILIRKKLYETIIKCASSTFHKFE